MRAAIVAALLLAACSSGSIDANAPIPTWVEASGYWTYGHWECPDGWTSSFHHNRFYADTVTCVRRDADDRAIEQMLKRYRPTR